MCGRAHLLSHLLADIPSNVSGHLMTDVLQVDFGPRETPRTRLCSSTLLCDVAKNTTRMCGWVCARVCVCAYHTGKCDLHRSRNRGASVCRRTLAPRGSSSRGEQEGDCGRLLQLFIKLLTQTGESPPENSQGQQGHLINNNPGRATHLTTPRVQPGRRARSADN